MSTSHHTELTHTAVNITTDRGRQTPVNITSHRGRHTFQHYNRQG